MGNCFAKAKINITDSKDTTPKNDVKSTTKTSMTNLEIQAEQSKKIDQYLRKEKERLELEDQDPKILILGSSDSGKSTFLKQLKILHGTGFSSEELKLSKMMLINNLLSICQRIISEINDEIIVSVYQLILDFCQSGTVNISIGLPDDVVLQIIRFWEDRMVKDTLKRLGDLIPATTSFFLDKFQTIVHPDYVLNHQDMLLFRSVTQTVSKSTFTIDTKTLHFFDVSGLKYHRKRWIPYFQHVNCILYVINLASYDQVLVEDGVTNRMRDALDLYSKIYHHDLLSRTDHILFFNKFDLYKIKIQQNPIKSYFTDFQGQPNSVSDGANYFQDLFKQFNKKGDRSVSVHLTCCTDTEVMKSIIISLTKSILNRRLDQITPT
ncbi:guanine nucleotide binding protein, alpha subunit [Globomyces pollinis-pini]|nr:guanine nucleotide binding protein, alpha subunit [Globomyces pollinis-pini]